jgi:hypothetical protein
MMTLSYADPHLPSARPHFRPSLWIELILIVLFQPSAGGEAPVADRGRGIVGCTKRPSPA